MTSVLNNEIKFNVLCHSMAKDNLSLAYKYAIDIFNDSMSHKDRCTKAIKASLLTVRSFLLCIPFINRITQFALRLLSPKLTRESLSYSQKEELEVRYSEEVRLRCSSKGSQTSDSLNQRIKKNDEFKREMQHQIIGILKCIEGSKEFREALRDGPFIGLNREEKKRMCELFALFLENSEGFQDMLEKDSLQNQESQKGFLTLIEKVFKRLFRDPQDFSKPLSEEEQSNFKSLAEEMQWDEYLKEDVGALEFL